MKKAMSLVIVAALGLGLVACKSNNKGVEESKPLIDISEVSREELDKFMDEATMPEDRIDDTIEEFCDDIVKGDIYDIMSKNNIVFIEPNPEDPSGGTTTKEYTKEEIEKNFKGKNFIHMVFPEDSIKPNRIEGIFDEVQDDILKGAKYEILDTENRDNQILAAQVKVTHNSIIDAVKSDLEVKAEELGKKAGADSLTYNEYYNQMNAYIYEVSREALKNKEFTEKEYTIEILFQYDKINNRFDCYLPFGAPSYENPNADMYDIYDIYMADFNKILINAMNLFYNVANPGDAYAEVTW